MRTIFFAAIASILAFIVGAAGMHFRDSENARAEFGLILSSELQASANLARAIEAGDMPLTNRQIASNANSDVIALRDLESRQKGFLRDLQICGSIKNAEVALTPMVIKDEKNKTLEDGLRVLLESCEADN